jgi:hypothetical protein
MNLRIAILYDDDEVMVDFTPQEFIKELTRLVEKDHCSVKQALEIIIKDLKKKTQKS